MTAENYLKEKEHLSQSMNGQDRLMDEVSGIKRLREIIFYVCLWALVFLSIWALCEIISS